jgi:hypothetical protein
VPKRAALLRPPREMPLGVAFSQSMFPSHARGVGSYIGPGWETPELQERFRQESKRDRTAQAKHYTKLDKQEAERVNREERERFAQSQRRA